jgi:hypothetical protein
MKTVKMIKRAKRAPVDFRWDALNWDFIKMLAEIANYSVLKYDSVEQYLNGRLMGEKSPVNHIYEHLRAFQAGEPHDHFGTMEHHLGAVAYNAMMESAYIDLFGFKGNETMMRTRTRAQGSREAQQLHLSEMSEMLDDWELGSREGLGGREVQQPVEASASPDVASTLLEKLSEVSGLLGIGAPHLPVETLNGLIDFVKGSKAQADLMAKDNADLRERVKQLEERTAKPIAEGETDWTAGFDHFEAQWKAGLNGARTPETISKWSSMLAALTTLRSKIPDLFTKRNNP